MRDKRFDAIGGAGFPACRQAGATNAEGVLNENPTVRSESFML